MRLNKYLWLTIGLLLGGVCLADGNAVDKVYHPYVQPLEWELEWRVTFAADDPLADGQDRQLHRLGLGRALAEYVFGEFYLIGEQTASGDFGLEAYEAEVLWQITEQGEFALDYGLLFEVEKDNNDDLWEAATTLLLEREQGRFSHAANLSVIYEGGDEIDNEWETALALQSRYRYSPRFEPALEWYKSQDSNGLGPVAMGTERLGINRALHWELGVIFGLNDSTPDYTLRGVLEFEF